MGNMGDWRVKKTEKGWRRMNEKLFERVFKTETMTALGHLPDTRQTQFKKVNLFAYVFLWSQKPLMPQMILKASRLNGRKGLVRYWNIEVPGNYSGFQVRRDIEMLNSKRWEEIVSFSPGLGQVCWQEWICQLPPNSFWLPKLSGKGGRNRGHQGTSYYLYQTWGILTIQVKGSVSCVYSWLSNSLCNIWSIGPLRHWRSNQFSITKASSHTPHL